jgi:hypothetical protein
VSQREPITELSAIELVHTASAAELLTLTLCLATEFRERGYAEGHQLEAVARFLANLVREHSPRAAEQLRRVYIGTRRAPWDASMPPD